MWKTTLKQKDKPNKQFLELSILNISIGYLVVQLIVFLLFKFMISAPTWSAIVVCMLILCISAVCMMITGKGIEIIDTTETKINEKRQYIKDLQIEVELLEEEEKDPELKQKLVELAKKIRLSDPISNDSVSNIEKEILDKVVHYNKSSNKYDSLAEIEILLLKRNKKVKALKG